MNKPTHLPKMWHAATAAAAFLFSGTACMAQAPDIAPIEGQDDYKVETVVDGIGIAWGMVWLPNGDMLISERSGQLRLVRDGQLLDQPISGLPEIHANGQGGLLDLELHPDYANNGWIYISFSDPRGEGEGSNTSLMRARLDGMQLVDSELLYQAGPNSPKGQHYAGRIEFDNQGFVYFAIGDRGQRDSLPQDLGVDGGKIYRLHDDGRVPDDNPFVDRDDAVAATFSYGHRNPQGLALHPETGELWSHEHGPRGGDEINLVKAGSNYGWPVISYGINYDGTPFTDKTHQEGMEQPLHYWDPSIAPSGMVFVTSDHYPDWKGHLLVGSLKFNYLVLVKLDGNEATGEGTLFQGIGRVRNVRQGPDGYIYVGTDDVGIKRIVPADQ